MPALTKSHSEVTHQPEPVMLALPDQGIVSRARDAPLYGCFPPMRIVRLHCVHARCAGFELVTSESDFVGAGISRLSQMGFVPLPGQVISERYLLIVGSHYCVMRFAYALHLRQQNSVPFPCLYIEFFELVIEVIFHYCFDMDLGLMEQVYNFIMLNMLLQYSLC